MTGSLQSRDARCESWLPDEEAWEAPRRLTEADLFTHLDGWRRAGCDLDDPEDRR